MPTYKFLNKETNEEWTEFMSISSLEEYLKNNPHIEQLVHGSPAVVYQAAQRLKTDDGFNDRLKEIKKFHKGSTIQTR